MTYVKILKKAQSASSAATLIVLIAGMILLYLLFLPSEEREALLQDKYVYPEGGEAEEEEKAVEETAEDILHGLIAEPLLSESPGQLYYLKESSYEHELSAVNLYTLTEAEVLDSLDSLYVKNGLFDQLFRNWTFYLDDPDNTDNVLLSFNVEDAQGRLQILFNGEQLFDTELSEGSPAPLELSTALLSDVNVLEFRVSDVGYRFWTTNEYQLEHLQVTGDVTDVSQQISKTTFTISDTEKYNLETAKLTFYPDCSPREVGVLKIMVNNDIIYSSIPDCQQFNVVSFSPTTLSAGDNYLIFKAEKGTYMIYNIAVETELAEQEYPTYYFDVPDDAFLYSEEVDRSAFTKEYLCGDADGVCSSGCSEDDDPDCCFEGRNQYWCDTQPADTELRCTEISEVDLSKCSSCATGYEDERGYAPEECEEQCGDDHDGVCPDGCSKYYDKDCCSAEDEDNFWCDEVPSYGIENVCETSLSEEECEQCPSGYKGKGVRVEDLCPAETSELVEVYEWYPGYEVYVVFTFVDDEERKTADVYVNGHKFSLDTYEGEYVRQITDYIEPGTNSLKIEPGRTIEIRKVEVVVKETD